MIAIKKTIFKYLLSGLLDKGTIKDFLTTLGDIYQTSDNVVSRCLMKQLIDMRYDNIGGVKGTRYEDGPYPNQTKNSPNWP